MANVGPNAREPNTTYIPPAHIWWIGGCVGWIGGGVGWIGALRWVRMGPNACVFELQWNIGFQVSFLLI